jgi:hypothetical protein
MLIFYLFNFLILFFTQASYEAHDAAKVFRGKYSEALRNARDEVIVFKGEFLEFFIFNVLYSTLLHLPPLRFHCAELRMLGSNPGPLQLVH